MNRPAGWMSLAAAALLLAAGCGKDSNSDETPATVAPAGEHAAGTTQVEWERAVPAPAVDLAPAAATGTFTQLDPAATGVDLTNPYDWDHPAAHLYAHGFGGGGVAIGDYDNDGRPDLYLTSQTGVDRLYRQSDSLTFVDVTEQAGLALETSWNAGAAFVDLDGDGHLDLYVCRYDAPNIFYRNQGDGTFVDEAAAFGLDYRGASVMATAADVDRDGDLDLFIVTNRLYPGPGKDTPPLHTVNGRTELQPGQEAAYAMQERLIDGEIQRYVVKAGERDVLLRNDGGSFTEVAVESGIDGFNPGLSATFWDADNDGDQDLYVTNDFWDADRFYLNDGSGSFVDVVAAACPTTPWFAMGADFGDINNDGRFDFLAADMSATTHFMSKLMMGDMNDSRWFLESAEPRQTMRNCLYLGTGTGRFMEVAWLAGLASTDWTWAVRFGDLDNDGLLDLIATNGTANHSFDPDHTKKLRDMEARLTKDGFGTPAVIAEAQWNMTRRLEPRRERNLAFRNTGDIRFERTDAWGLDLESVSFGAALADLDRDGDLDLVVNNVGQPVSIHRNDAATGNALLLQLRGGDGNRFGIGATVTVTAGDHTWVRQLSVARGYMSASDPVVHVGIGDHETVDQVEITWPDGTREVTGPLAAGKLHTIAQVAGQVAGRAASPADASGAEAARPRGVLQETTRGLGLADEVAVQTPFDDFVREPLLPAKLTTQGQALAVGDFDGDGADDLFVGGSAGEPGRLYRADGSGSYAAVDAGAIAADRAAEDAAAVFFDADGDGDSDLYVGSGGGRAAAGDQVYRDRFYRNDGTGTFEAVPAGLPDLAENTAVVAAADFDRDGDLDLFCGARSVPGAYPTTPRSRLLVNEGGAFVDATGRVAARLAAAGLVTAAIWTDVDDDGWVDLMLTTEWGPVQWWRNDRGTLVDQTAAAGLADLTGWWNSITAVDLDGDRALEYIVGNAGLNTKYVASPEKPERLYYGTFDQTAGPQIVEAKTSGASVLPVRGRSCSSAAMPFIADKLPTFRDFAGATLDEIYGAESLDSALQLEATTLASGVLDPVMEGEVLRFAWRPLPRLAQAAPIYGVVGMDVEGDGDTDLILAMNFSDREPETGRWNGSMGLVLTNNGAGELTALAPGVSGLFIPGDGRAAVLVDPDDDGRPAALVSVINEPLQVYAVAGAPVSRPVSVRLEDPGPNRRAIGSRITLISGGGADARDRTAEITAGAGYRGQGPAAAFFSLRDAPVRAEVRWPDGAVTEHEISDDDVASGSVVIRRTPSGG